MLNVMKLGKDLKDYTPTNLGLEVREIYSTDTVWHLSNPNGNENSSRRRASHGEWHAPS